MAAIKQAAQRVPAGLLRKRIKSKKCITGELSILGCDATRVKFPMEFIGVMEFSVLARCIVPPRGEGHAGSHSSEARVLHAGEAPYVEEFPER